MARLGGYLMVLVFFVSLCSFPLLHVMDEQTRLAGTQLLLGLAFAGYGVAMILAKERVRQPCVPERLQFARETSCAPEALRPLVQRLTQEIRTAGPIMLPAAPDMEKALTQLAPDQQAALHLAETLSPSRTVDPQRELENSIIFGLLCIAGGVTIARSSFWAVFAVSGALYASTWVWEGIARIRVRRIAQAIGHTDLRVALAMDDPRRFVAALGEMERSAPDLPSTPASFAERRQRLEQALQTHGSGGSGRL